MKKQLHSLQHAQPLRQLWKMVLWAAMAFLAAGCQVLTYTGPNGEHFSRTSLGATTTLASLTVEADTNGIRRVELRGYTNDTAQALGTVTEAAVRAALQ